MTESIAGLFIMIPPIEDSLPDGCPDQAQRNASITSFPQSGQVLFFEKAGRRGAGRLHGRNATVVFLKSPTSMALEAVKLSSPIRQKCPLE